MNKTCRQLILAILALLLSSTSCVAVSGTAGQEQWLPFPKGTISSPGAIAPPQILVVQDQAKASVPWIPADSPESLLRKADQEISNLNLPLAERYLVTVLQKQPHNKQAQDLLQFVHFLAGKKPGSPTGQSSPQAQKTSDSARRTKKILAEIASLGPTPAPQTLLKMADREIACCHISGARLILQMILKDHPEYPQAKELLGFADFLAGKERDPLDNRKTARRLLEGTGCPEFETYSGYFYRKNNVGTVESTAVIETSMEKLHGVDLSGSLMIESRSYAYKTQESKSQVVGAKLNYSPSSTRLISLTMAPEILNDGKTINQLELGMYSKMNDWKFGFEANKNSFRDNLYSIQQHMQKRDLGVSVSRKFGKKTELRQGVLWETISDTNSSLSFDTKLKYRFLPEWALDLKYYQSGYQRQESEDGETLNYWAPKNYRSVILALGWKKRFAAKWKCEFETSLSGSSTQETADETENLNQALGVRVYTGYQFSTGDIGLSYADRVNLSAREKRFSVGGNMRF